MEWEGKSQMTCGWTLPSMPRRKGGSEKFHGHLEYFTLKHKKKNYVFTEKEPDGKTIWKISTSSHSDDAGVRGKTVSSSPACRVAQGEKAGKGCGKGQSPSLFKMGSEDILKGEQKLLIPMSRFSS